MKILQNPNQILRKKAEKVRKIDTKITDIIAKMKKVLNSSVAGVALAAPQIGISKAIVITGFKEIGNEKEKSAQGGPASDGEKIVIPEYVLLNPKLIKSSTEKIKEEEGCLSLMDEEIRGDVERAKEIMIEAMDEKGKIQKIKAKGFFCPRSAA